MNLRVSRSGQFTDDTANSHCDGSHTFRHPTHAEAPMPPYDLSCHFEWNHLPGAFCVSLRGSTPAFTVTASVFKW
jgi:hypothetical protein